MTNRSRFRAGSWLIFILVASSRLVAQTPGSDVANARFEVNSVKPNKTGDQNSRLGMNPQNGRFMATNVTVKQLITNAYNLRSFQVTGGPSWLDTDRFDLMATVGHEIKPTATGPPPEVIQMVKNLLADRFKLVAHTETREMPVYNLVLARSDGKLGPKMRPAEVDCAALMARGGPPPTTPPGQMPPCSTRISGGTLTGRGGAIAQIARTFAGLPSIGRLVVDKTGLTGSFDIDLEWTENPSADTAGPSMFTALQEQLGLKLESARGPMEVLAIDGAEQPTAD